MSQTNENNKNCLTPKKALNKAYLKKKPLRNDIELFKTNLKKLLGKINEIEREENQKNHIRDFLRDTYYIDTNEINTKDSIDLVIHLGTKASDNVGVIIEAKRPSNKSEMIAKDELNKKAMQELVLYYLRERIIGKNLDIKNLVATNINEWYIFDAIHFEKYFANNKELVRQFIDFQEGRMSGTDTSFFYNNIASKYIDEIKNDIGFVFFNIQEYFDVLNNNSIKDDTSLIALYKILSPEHLLKLPFENDSNSLNKNFYSELLHIIGLEEVKDGSKRLIQRKKDGSRNGGSLLESTIFQMDEDSNEDRLFDNSLELVITWINRILFLKLIEAQQIKYQKGNHDYAFLNKNKISGFDELNNLFFKVLAVKPENRHQYVKGTFAYVPYLNSSLFEKSEIETKYFPISQLTDIKLPIYSASVLKDNAGKKSTGELSTLEYLFEFLNAYDFSSEGAEEVQENNKTLINASVLGLIFEKLNGYKDGSFFTPGFITMYMCKETIQKAVVQKFNEIKQWNCKDLVDLHNKIEDRVEANSITNSLHVCDPAVGSGHFLVSALNEILSVKSYLGILLDKKGKRLKDYTIVLENDEVIITDEDGSIFSYNPNSAESRRIQETLFNEKRTIIENCLFGVDINPNSVKICRLRLWIELLKSAYYTEDSNYTQLETLPNIDINIKCGNSLISRFNTNIDIKPELKKLRYTVQQYKDAVLKYKNATSKGEKQELETLIQNIKNNFRSEVENNDKEFKEKKKLMIELDILGQGELFELSEKELAIREKRRNEIDERIRSIDIAIEEIRSNKIFEHSFEWRFEFPEVLNDDGDFVGFDVVIGNPPYLNFKMYSHDEKTLFSYAYNEIFDGKADIYYFFFAKGMSLLKSFGKLCFITSRYWLEAEFAVRLRKYFSNKATIQNIIDFKNVTIFDGIGIKALIISIENNEPSDQSFFSYKFTDEKRINIVDILHYDNIVIFNNNIRATSKWLLGDSIKISLINKIKNNSVSLESIAFCTQGIVTGLDKAFITETNEFIALPDRFVKTFIKVGDVFQYIIRPVKQRKLVYTNSIKNLNSYPDLLNRLQVFKNKLSGRREVKNGKIRWFDLQWARNPETFEQEKIVCRYKASVNTFALDINGSYSSADTTIITIKKGHADQFQLKYLLALLNSKLLDYFFKSYGKLMDYRFEYYPGPVGNIKIKYSDSQEKFIFIIDKILEKKSIDANFDTSDLENQINNLVYELYNITAEEIEIVEKG